MHALHTNGTISSFGKDPHNVGAFGLGDRITALFRGVQNAPQNDDGILDGSRRRTIWFEPLMEKRMRCLHNMERPWEAPLTVDGETITRIMRSNEMRNRYGDFFEDEGRHWEEGVTDENEMGAYFALKVAAAGWHSAALVLVDEEKAERARQKHIISSPANGHKEMVARSISKASETFWASLLGLVLWSLKPLLSWGRWFLGLPTPNNGSMNLTEMALQGERKDDADGPKYVWEDQPLPRLWDTEGGAEVEDDDPNSIWRSAVR